MTGVVFAALAGGQEPLARTPAELEAPETTAREIGVLLSEKARRTAVQRKIGSRLLKAVQSAGGRPSARDPVLVDIRADVTPAVLEHIRSLDGAVVNQVPQYRAIRARLPLASLDDLAGLAAVQWIRCADLAVTHGQQTGEGGESQLSALSGVGVCGNDRTTIEIDR